MTLGEPLWRDFSAAYVAGSGFTLDPDQQQTLSLEYASGHRWGDTFTYLNTTFFRDDQRSYSLFKRVAEVSISRCVRNVIHGLEVWHQ